MFSQPNENRILSLLTRYQYDGDSLYEPAEEPFKKGNRLPSASNIRPLLFEELSRYVSNKENAWYKHKLDKFKPNDKEFWKQIKKTQEYITKCALDFPPEPDQIIPSSLVFLKDLKCPSEHLVITLVVYSTIDYDLEKLFASLRNRADKVLGRKEKQAASIHNVKEWIENLSNFEHLGIFNNRVRPGPPYWDAVYRSFIESLEFHENELQKFRKANWPSTQLHKAYSAGKTNKEKAYRTWSINGLFELLKNSGADESTATETIQAIYAAIGVDINVQNFINRQKKNSWELPDPNQLWTQLSAHLYAISIAPDIGKRNK